MKRLIILVAAVTSAFSLGAQNRKLTLDDVIGGSFYGNSAPSITPMADGESYLATDGDCILKYSFKTGAVTDTILNLRTVKGDKPFALGRFILSPTEDVILLEEYVSKIFRRSYTANYYIFTIRNNRAEKLTDGGPVQVPSFSPDGHNIAFVRDNNIF